MRGKYTNELCSLLARNRKVDTEPQYCENSEVLLSWVKGKEMLYICEMRMLVSIVWVRRCGWWYLAVSRTEIACYEYQFHVDIFLFARLC